MFPRLCRAKPRALKRNNGNQACKAGRHWEIFGARKKNYERERERERESYVTN